MAVRHHRVEHVSRKGAMQFPFQGQGFVLVQASEGPLVVQAH
ncbi:hypothetical protein ABT294_31045 [Nonomuraea sp. NPDC000554]